MSKDLDDVRKLRMPVFSWDYEDSIEAERWFLMARAYFDCSHFLFAEMVEEELDRNYHRALVAVSLFMHSIELLLKAAVVQTGKEISPSHDLEQLYRQYKKLYPGTKFEFTGDILSVVTPRSDMPHNEFPRYPMDHAGKPWTGYTHVDIAVWFVRLDDFEKDFDRLQPLMQDRYPVKVNVNK
jgi:HEPN domain-containing protein